MKRLAPKGGAPHHTVYYTESAKSGLRSLLAFVALGAKRPALSGILEARRVVAGTLGEPPTRSRQFDYSYYAESPTLAAPDGLIDA